MKCVCLYTYSNIRDQMKRSCPSVCHTWIPIWEMKWHVVCPSCFDPNFRGEIKHSSFDCLSYSYPTKCFVDPSMRRKRRRSDSDLWRKPLYQQKMKWYVAGEMLSVLDPIISGEMKRNFSACLSHLNPNIKGVMKRCLSICPSYLYPNMRGEMKYQSVLLGPQH